MLGPELRFEHHARIAIAGADLEPTLDGAPLPAGIVECPVGSVLRFGDRRSGARTYVAVDGGITVPRVLGSRSTHVMSGLGGIGGRAVRAGDRIALGEPALQSLITTRRELQKHTGSARLRVMKGPQSDYFHPSALDTLQRTRFVVSPQSDRMGYRLTGGALVEAGRSGEMVSDVTVVGAVQVPPSGQPILLMADRQTTGGYPQIAVVITADLPLAAQLAPGDTVTFELCTRLDAIAALRQQEGFFVGG
jgi:antagonist of KipI